MEYIINIWRRSQSTGTVCVFRSTDRNAFESKKSEYLKKIPAFHDFVRTTVFEKYVIFSYAENADAFRCWLNLDYFKKPLAVRYSKIREVKANAK